MTTRQAGAAIALSFGAGVLWALVRLGVLALVLIALPSVASAQESERLTRTYHLSEWLVLTGHTFDAAATQRCIGAGRCYEANPFLARFDDPLTFTGAKMGIAWGQLYLSRQVRKTHPRLALILNTAIGSGFIALGARNWRLASCGNC